MVFVPAAERRHGDSFRNPVEHVQSTVVSTGKRIGRRAALEALVQALERCDAGEARRLVLDALIDVYAGHKDNYALLHAGDGGGGAEGSGAEGGRDASLGQIIERLGAYEESLYEPTLQIVRHIITVAACVPTQELVAVSKLLLQDISLHLQLIICRTLNEIVAHDASYRDIFRQLGILHALLHTVRKCYAKSQECHGECQSNSDIGFDVLMIESLQVQATGNRQCAHLIREQGLPCFLQLVWHDALHSAVLKLLCQIAASGFYDDVEACIAGLCEVRCAAVVIILLAASAKAHFRCDLHRCCKATGETVSTKCHSRVTFLPPW